MKHPSIPKRNPDANTHSVDELMRMNKSVEMLIVDSDSCNDKGCTVLDLSSFSNLMEFKVGDYSFIYVKEVRLIGLRELKRVVIGKNCFTDGRDNGGDDSSRHFYLKNCERVRELNIGCKAFIDYSVCEIENVPSLEVITMGDVFNYGGAIFCHASLELKSDSERIELMNRLAQFERTCIRG